MIGRGRITLPTHEIEVTETGTGKLGDFSLEASFGDYGRHTNPSLTAQSGETTFVFEFASPDEARKLGEKLFALARAAEDKTGQRGPEYRARIAREEFMAEFKSLVGRVESAVSPAEVPDLLKALVKQ